MRDVGSSRQKEEERSGGSGRAAPGSKSRKQVKTPAPREDEDEHPDQVRSRGRRARECRSRRHVPSHADRHARSGACQQTTRKQSYNLFVSWCMFVGKLEEVRVQGGGGKGEGGGDRRLVLLGGDGRGWRYFRTFFCAISGLIWSVTTTKLPLFPLFFGPLFTCLGPLFCSRWGILSAFDGCSKS